MMFAPKRKKYVGNTINRFATRCFVAIIILLLAACEPEVDYSKPVEVSEIVIENSLRTDFGGRQPCSDGLRVVMTQEGKIVFDKTAEAGKDTIYELANYDAQGLPLIEGGTELEVEAWCYDTSDGDIGYIKIKGKLRVSGVSLSRNITVEAQDNNGRCSGSFPYVLRRGKNPCIRATHLR